MEDLGLQFRRERKRQKKTLEQVSAEVGVTHSIMSRWETGKAPLPVWDKLQLWASVLGMVLNAELCAPEDSGDPRKELAKRVDVETAVRMLALLDSVKKT